MPSAEITRRRALIALGTVGVGSAAAGAGTYSAFSDSGTDSGSFSAGTLNLGVGDTQSLSFTTSDIKPGDSGSGYVDLVPSGSIDGNLTIEVMNISVSVGNTDGMNLDEHLDLEIWLDEGSSDDGSFDSTSDIGLQQGGTIGSGTSSNPIKDYNATTWTEAIAPMTNTWTFHVSWSFADDSSNINDAQGDSVTIDFEFRLEQAGGGTQY